MRCTKHLIDQISNIPNIEYYSNEFAEKLLKTARFASIEPKLRTKPICNFAVITNGYALQFVPKKLKLANGGELCRIAVSVDEVALCFVPDELKHLMNMK